MSDPDATETVRAFVPVSFAFCFFGLYEAGCAIMILVSSARTLKVTVMTATTIVTCICVVSFVSFQLATLDHRTRMVNASNPSQVIRGLSYGTQVLIPVTQAGLCTMSVMIAKILFSATGRFYRAVCVLAGLTMVFDIALGGIGMYITLNNNQAPKIVVTIMGLVGMLATISESALSISCCIGFLKKLSKGLSVNFAVLVYDIITKHNGQRFIVIILLRLVKVGMLTAVISAPTGPAAQSFKYIHSWMFGLEIAALTSFSFEATKRMVNEHGMQSKRNSGRTTSEASQTVSNTGVKSNALAAPSPRPIRSNEL